MTILCLCLIIVMAALQMLTSLKKLSYRKTKENLAELLIIFGLIIRKKISHFLIENKTDHYEGSRKHITMTFSCKEDSREIVMSSMNAK